MSPVERELLNAIHGVDKKVVELETKIDDAISGRFKDLERRTKNLEVNQRWLVLAILGSVLTAIMNVILK